MRIFLIGFMGCGKTTLGKKLAKDLNYNFIDLDTYIEKKTNKTITEIFGNIDTITKIDPLVFITNSHAKKIMIWH